jgi:hypothetical protein
VNVTVTDPYDRLVTGLEPDNFRVFEDNVEQEVVTFSCEDAPISIGVIFDFSGSMANKIGKSRQAAVEFFKTADLTLLAKNNQRKYPAVTYVLQSGVDAPAHGSKDMPIWALRSVRFVAAESLETNRRSNCAS